MSIPVALDHTSQRPNVVVIGASAGGVDALTTLVRALPTDLDAAVFIVLHIPPHTPSNLASIPIEERILLMRQLAQLAPDAETTRHYQAEAGKTEARLKPLHAAALDPDLIGNTALKLRARWMTPAARSTTSIRSAAFMCRPALGICPGNACPAVSRQRHAVR